MNSTLASVRALRELEGDRVPYQYKGMPVLIPRIAHDEIERLKAENTELRESRRALMERGPTE